MRCLFCGHADRVHCRADGACIGCDCKAFVERWADPAPAPKAEPAPAPEPAKQPPSASEK